MGFNQNQTLRNFCTFIFFFLLLVSLSCSSPCHDETPPRNSPSVRAATRTGYEVLCIKKTRPFVLQSQETMNKNRKKRRRVERKKNKDSKTSRPFSVMLPKGFVPPSGSSPCHNMKPDLVAFYCHLSKSKP